MPEAVLDISEVRKTYRRGTEALKGLSLSVPAGSVFGLLGPNGAGKSTLVKILTTIIRPSRCEGMMLGRPIGHKPTLRRVGYLPEHARFPGYLTGRQVVQFSAGLAGLSKSQAGGKVEELLERVRMAKVADRRVRTYSKGMKQRIGLAQALVCNPDLVFLDEPTDGVDPEGRLEIRNLVSELRGEGRTVFINTHLLAELEQVADRVAILSQGRLVREGTLAELSESRQGFEIVAATPVPDEVRRELEGLGVIFEQGKMVRETGAAEDIQELIDVLRRSGVVIESVLRKRLSLEELFLEAVGESRNGDV